jgi:hypothetical protein
MTGMVEVKQYPSLLVANPQALYDLPAGIRPNIKDDFKSGTTY